MRAKEFRKKGGWSKADFFNGENDIDLNLIEEFAEAYYQSKVNNVSLNDVSQQRELLISFFNWYENDPKELSNNETIVDAYIEEINCG
jgi:hypothetical protein